MQDLWKTCLLHVLIVIFPLATVSRAAPSTLGREVSMSTRLADGEEFKLSLPELIAYGRKLFTAQWTVQEGAGRPLSKGTGASLVNPAAPLVFPRNFNRLSGPDANSCAGCHNAPFGIPGGSGDIITSAFVLGQRFDFIDFDSTVSSPMSQSHDETGRMVPLHSMANLRATTGMYGSGYLEMLARQMTADLHAIRDSTPLGKTRALVSKGVAFGSIKRIIDERWDIANITGLGAASIASFGYDPPSLLVMPFHQSGAAVSLRQFTNNALNHHHGLQSSERFGTDTDPDGDGFTNELSRAEVTALTLYQATMPVPGRVIPHRRMIEAEVLLGERKFEQVGCDRCHVLKLPLRGAQYSEPNPYNPLGNLQPDAVSALMFDLNSGELPQPRLQAEDGVTWVPAYTDLKLHDITSGPQDPNREALDMQHQPGMKGFFVGNRYFITRPLWGMANQPPYFHHGKFTTIREAIQAHAGEAQPVMDAYEALSPAEKSSLIEFLKTLQVLPPGTRTLVIDDTGQPRQWPPHWARHNPVR